MKTNRRKLPQALAKGQLWRLDDMHIQIVELGKRLVHYRMLRQLGQMRRTQMSGIDAMEKYLTDNRARLVEDACKN